MATPGRLGTVGVIGNGIIGHGVAQVFAAAGTPARLIGRSQSSLDAAVGKIRESLRQFEDRGLIPSGEAGRALGRIST
ncbi:MAG: 3-hydroxyacyl-CoA dehydrogenase NAD-binding domain-containing protein, partial [Candidatus Rokuibacteriota bacterium]